MNQNFNQNIENHSGFTSREISTTQHQVEVRETFMPEQQTESPIQFDNQNVSKNESVSSNVLPPNNTEDIFSVEIEKLTKSQIASLKKSKYNTTKFWLGVHAEWIQKRKGIK